MPDKWVRKYSGDERESQSYDETFRVSQVAAYGQDVAGEQLVQIAVDGVGNLSTKITDGTTELGIDTSGNVKTTGDDALSIAAGTIPGVSSVNKFGHADDFDTGDGEITVWDGANDGGLNEMTYNYSSTADIDTISSSNNGDTQDIEIVGLDGTYAPVTQTVTLTGQTKATLGTPLMRVFRLINRGSTDIAGTVYCYVNGDITAGVPDTSADVRALILGANNQTLMSIYTVPLGKTAYMTGWYGFAAGSNKSADFDIYLKARPVGEVFQIKHHSTLSDVTTSKIEQRYNPYNKFAAKTDIEIRVNILDVGIVGAGFSAGFDIILVDD